MRFFLLFAIALASCTPEAEPIETVDTEVPAVPDVDDTIVGITNTTPSLTIFHDVIEVAAMAETLRDSDAAYTVFAPSDAAMRALDADARASLLSDATRARAFVSAHVVAIRMFSQDIIDGITIEAIEDNELALSVDGSSITVRGASGTTANVVTPDLDTSNGVVHVIDAPLTR